jgi:hypothetical protein
MALATQEKIVTVREPNWRSQSRFVVGVDVGQAVDPTAVAIIENFDTRLDGSSPLESHFHVRHLQRLPLGMSYPNIVIEIGTMMTRPPLDNADCELVVDATGCGMPVFDLFRAAGLKAIGVIITGGSEEGQTGSACFTVPKSTLVSLLDARLHTGELKFAKELHESPALQNELRDFRRAVSEAGRFSYSARAGKHDDLILAVAIALWRTTKRKPSWRSPTQKPQIKLGHEAMRRRFAR